MKETNLDKLSRLSSELRQKLRAINGNKEKPELDEVIDELEKEIDAVRQDIAQNNYRGLMSRSVQFFFAVAIAAAGIITFSLHFVEPIVAKDVLISQKNDELTEKNLKIQQAELKLEKIKLSEAEEKNKQLSNTLEKQNDEIEEYKIRMRTRIALAKRRIENLKGKLETEESESLDLENLTSELVHLSDSLNHTIIITVKRDSAFYPAKEANNGVSGFIKVSFEIDQTGKATAFQTIAQSTGSNFGASTVDVINNYLSKEPIKPGYLLNVRNTRWQAMVVYKAN